MIGDDGRRGRLGAGVDGSVEARFPLVAGFIVLVFIIFAVRLFQLQIIEGEDLSTKSKGNSVRLVRLEAPRGEILDRHGRVLATTRPAFGLQVMPSDLRRRDITFQSLAMLLDGDAAQMAERAACAKHQDELAV